MLFHPVALGFKAAFPKMSSALVFLVSFESNIEIELFHEPTKAPKSIPPFFDNGQTHLRLCFTQRLFREPTLNPKGQFMILLPAFNDFTVRERKGFVLVDMHD